MFLDSLFDYFLFRKKKPSEKDFEKMLKRSVSKFNKWRERNPESVVILGVNQRLTGMNLKGVNFTNAFFQDSAFKNSNLESANFENADLSYVSFKGSNLKNACFKKARLDTTNLSETNLDGVDFTDAFVFACSLPENAPISNRTKY